MKLLPLALLVACTLSFLPSAGAAALPTAEVNINLYLFLAPATPISSGGLLTFHNIELVQHHQPQGLQGEFLLHLGNGQSGSVVIPQPAGTVILYRCGLHPFMGGAIVVV